VAEDVRGSLKPLSVFLYDGKKLEALPVLYWVHDIDTMGQRAKYVDIFYVKGDLTLKECPVRSMVEKLKLTNNKLQNFRTLLLQPCQGTP